MRIVRAVEPRRGADIAARIVAAAASELSASRFVVENRVTAGGIVGMQQVAESRPRRPSLAGHVDPRFAVNTFVFKN